MIRPPITACAATFAAFLSFASAAPLEYAPVQTANPLKGFMPFSGNYPHALPHSMAFFYLPLNDLMSGPKTFTWESLDSQLETIAARGRHAVFRIYLDYPKKPSGVPGFLRHGPDNIAGTEDDLVMHSYNDYANTGISRSPDYTNPHLRAALINFIAALGARYDGDPRIGFIQLGLLGFWGEWHTFPYTGGKHPDWQPPSHVQEEILAAYDRAFERTLLVVREPKAAFFAKYAIGYHDDSFAYTTIAPPAWHFSGKLAAHGQSERWRTQPIGGEIRPELQPGMWSDPSIIPAGQDYSDCVNSLHPSWLLAHGAFSNKLNPTASRLAARQSLELGYEFHLPTAAITSTFANRPIKITTSLRNTGVAPFYYDWPLELAVLDPSGKIVHTIRPKWSLTALLPGDPDRPWSHEIPADTLAPGDYRLLLRAVNPLPDGLPLRFANTTQDADLPGWLTLGRIQLPN